MQGPSLEFTSKVITEFLIDVGLGGFKVEIFERPTHFRLFTIGLTKDVEIPPMASSHTATLDAFMTPLRNDLLNSVLFQTRTQGLADTIKSLEQELDAMRARCERLKAYETHFKLSFLLTHGKPSETN